MDQSSHRQVCAEHGYLGISSKRSPSRTSRLHHDYVSHPDFAISFETETLLQDSWSRMTATYHVPRSTIGDRISGKHDLHVPNRRPPHIPREIEGKITPSKWQQDAGSLGDKYLLEQTLSANDLKLGQTTPTSEPARTNGRDLSIDIPILPFGNLNG
ncbi:LOW QUALITY PROTEIN: hypothetical protein MAR_001168 [Mya arenaria]|uniref:HTH psq-type domain-containing protein n=1 Tax=Mya arenaria TaxID=6604 RepID=A0ABY7FB41_MYAAR|nr:LOW QUALITY PROTEIN: hypothetical protein MAR_001168 [Mya arenaria]